MVGSLYVPRLADRGDGRPTWVEIKQIDPKQLTENLHKEGKVNLSEEKVLEKEAQNSEKATSLKAAQSVVSKIMQWENAIIQGSEPKFNFEMVLTQPDKMHETTPGKDEGPQSPVAMLFDAKVGWVTETIGPTTKHWKRLAREIKGKSTEEGPGQETKKRTGLTPLQELDPNVVDHKR